MLNNYQLCIIHFSALRHCCMCRSSPFEECDSVGLSHMVLIWIPRLPWVIQRHTYTQHRYVSARPEYPASYMQIGLRDTSKVASWDIVSGWSFAGERKHTITPFLDLSLSPSKYTDFMYDSYPSSRKLYLTQCDGVHIWGRKSTQLSWTYALGGRVRRAMKGRMRRTIRAMI